MSKHTPSTAGGTAPTYGSVQFSSIQPAHLSIAVPATVAAAAASHRPAEGDDDPFRAVRHGHHPQRTLPASLPVRAKSSDSSVLLPTTLSPNDLQPYQMKRPNSTTDAVYESMRKGGEDEEGGVERLDPGEEEDGELTPGYDENAVWETMRRPWQERGLLSTRGGVMSSAGSMYFVVCSMAFTGMLAMPSTLAGAGWLSVILIVIVSLVCNYTAKQFIALLYRPTGKLTSYAAVARACFGRVAGRVVVVYQSISYLSLCSLFFVLIGMNMHDLVPALEIREWILVAMGAIWPLTFFKTPRNALIVPMFGFTLTLVLFACIVVKSSLQIQEHKVQGKELITTVQGMAMAFGTTVFCFSGHAMLPAVESTMKKPWQFGSLMDISYLIITTLYLGSSIVAYAAYGDFIDSPVILNLRGIMKSLLDVMVVVHVSVTYPVFMNPVCRKVESHFIDTRQYATLYRTLLRSVVLFVTALCAILMPYFAHFLSLIGSVLHTCLALIFPAVLIMMIHRRSMRWFSWLLNIFILVLGVVGMVAGSWASIAYLIDDYRDSSA